ncbi:PQQ-binding-like beta-propeller repeat protein [Streptomyces sp. C]|uniref:outer membrane protein assembly factor BamB family protein n=1 Tax=Streptomyces sp. C TaxID=253839 RepID=UPI0001B56C54|nr:PQQ-binding-like beta-propeller repeat protein [Streptomyces sp. C]
MSFKNIFDNGGDQAGSADQAGQKLGKDTPGAGSVSEEVRSLESERDPWLVRQTAHGAFDVMGFLGPLFQSTRAAAAAQLQVTADPASASAMASSTTKAFGPPGVTIRDEDMPNPADLSKLIAHKRSHTLVATGLGTSEGVAADPANGTVYVADRGGLRLSAVKADTGAQRVAASALGDIGDVEVDGQGTAYTTDWAGGRLLAVNLSDGTSRKIADVPGAYGVALDAAANRAYVTNWTDGQLIAVDLPGGRKTTIATGLGQGIAGVALDGRGKAYVGQKDNGAKLYEITLAGGASRVVATLPAGARTIRVELDGAGRAYTIDHANGLLHEITLADGAHRVVASGLGTCEGLALEGGWIYVSNREGQLWQIDRRAAQAPGGIGKVAP